MIATAQMENVETARTWQWNSHNFWAMNTNVYTRLYSQTDNAVLRDVERLFASFENRLSRFKPNSELTKLNHCTQEAFKASPTLISAIEVALLAAEATGGLYDPTILTHLEKAGYDRSFEQVENRQPLSSLSSLPTVSEGNSFSLRPHSFRGIHLNRAGHQIYKPMGLKLDLGGMGKGWTVDRAADRLQGLGPFLVNAGGDIFAYQSPPGEKGWQIDLVHPLRPEHFMARLYLNHQALATSTITKRRWQRKGQLMHHLIDPRTGQPAQTDALSVTVVANRTVLAEVYAKVVLILGVEQGLAWLQKMPGIEGLVYTTAGDIVYTDGIVEILDRVKPAGYAP